MVSKMIRFYCKPDMTSLWLLRQWALRSIFHEGFWKTDQDFMIMIHSNFLAVMHDFQDNEVVLPTIYDVVVSSPVGAFQVIFHDIFWKSDHNFLMVIHSNFLAAMHGFRDNKVIFQARYDVIVISPPGGALPDFSWCVLKEWPWLHDSDS